MKNFNFTLKIASIALFCINAFAELKLDNIYTDNMVLQRDTHVSVCGYANPNANVNVEFSGQRKSVKSDANGRWTAFLSPMKASFAPNSLKVSSQKQSVQINNVLVGDVWLCSGQSNIDMPIAGHTLLREKLKNESNKNVRICLVRRTKPSAENSPKKDADLQLSWCDAQGGALQSFSPLAYYFAKKFSDDKSVPVGLVEAAVGGSRIQPWLPEISKNVMTDFDHKTSGGAPSHLYFNTMINPFKDMTFKGVLWWQGESSSLYPERYGVLFKQMIQDWRKEFKNPKLPFVFVVLASHKAVDGDVTNEAWAWLRESQLKALELENTYAVSALDIGEFEDIHPQNKELVADRVNSIVKRMATENELKTQSPMFESFEVKNGGNVIVKFTNDASKLVVKSIVLNNKKNMDFGKDPDGFVLKDDELSGFEICGKDKIFYPAKAKILNKTQVALKSDKVQLPIAVRYMWKTFALGNLYNDKDFPAMPFRTDNFKAPDFLGRFIGLDLSTKDLSDFKDKFVPSLKTGESELKREFIDNTEIFRAIKVPAFSGRYAYFKAPENFKNIDKNKNIILRIAYKDSGPDTITLMYDSNDIQVRKGQANAGAWKKLGAIKIEDSNKLKYVDFKISDAKFAGRLNGADIRLQSMPNLDFEILGVFIKESE